MMKFVPYIKFAQDYNTEHRNGFDVDLFLCNKIVHVKKIHLVRSFDRLDSREIRHQYV